MKTRVWSLRRILLCALLLLNVGTVRAQAASSPEGSGGGGSAQSSFWDNMAVGMAVIRPAKRSISNAAIVSNVVRVTGTVQSQQATLLLARHFYPFTSNSVGHCGKGTDKNATGMAFVTSKAAECVGAMVAVGLGSTGVDTSSSVINFVGIGLSIGGQTDDAKTAWNLGFGVGRKFGVQVLGDGFVENQAAPTGETQIRYKTVDVAAPFIFFTGHW